jgi:biopolymer transport protein TolR
MCINFQFNDDKEDTKMQRPRRKIVENSGPLADLAFMLLFFFMVTTTMHQETGIPTDLPEMGASVVSVQNVMSILLNANNDFMVDGKIVDKRNCKLLVLEQLRQNTAVSVQLKTNEMASYDTYVQLYDAVRSAYMVLYNEEAQRQFGVDFKSLKGGRKKIISSQIPIRIMEPEYLN